MSEQLPVTPESTAREFAIPLLKEAATRYQAASLAYQKIRAVRPQSHLHGPARAAFLASDRYLAEIMDSLIDKVSPLTRSGFARSKSIETCVECGMSFDGFTYVLSRNRYDLDPETTLVTSVPLALIVDLD